jgi:hypothetical protein
MQRVAEELLEIADRYQPVLLVRHVNPHLLTAFRHAIGRFACPPRCVTLTVTPN